MSAVLLVKFSVGYIWLYLSLLLMFSFAITKYYYIMSRFNSVPDAVG